MRLKSPFTSLFSLVVFCMLIGWACGGGGSGDGGSQQRTNPFGLGLETVASAKNPVALTFAPDGRLFFAEKYTGDIKIVDASGKLLDTPFAHVDAANWLNLDWGLTGLALDPDFATNHYVYAFYTEVVTPSDTSPVGRPVLVRFTDQNNQGTEKTVVSDNFPPTRKDHQGFKANGSIHFGPDRALYMTVGDYDWNKEGPNGKGAAQDLSIPLGKVLRIDSSGKAASGNPFAGRADADARIFAYGFNQGSALAFQPQSGGLYTTDSTGSCEELDLLQAGGNYGWPDVGEFPFSDCYIGDQVDPIFLFAKGTSKPGDFLSGPGVSGLAFLTGSKYPAIGAGLLACESQTGIMRRLVLTAPSFNQVTANDVVIDDCQADVTVAADGTIYYSNKVEIKKLTPPAATQTAAGAPPS